MNDLDRLIKQAEAAGLKYRRGRVHDKLVDPATGRSVSISATPSCVNAHRNVRRDLKKYLGVVLP